MGDTVRMGDRDDWRIDFARYGGPFIVEPSNTTANPHNGETIAKVFASHDANGHDRDFPLTQRRSYMIAAAPSMLALLQQLIAAIDSGNLEMSSPDIGEPGICDPHPWHEEWMHYVREALARAVPASANQ